MSDLTSSNNEQDIGLKVIKYTCLKFVTKQHDKLVRRRVRSQVEDGCSVEVQGSRQYGLREQSIVFCATNHLRLVFYKQLLCCEKINSWLRVVQHTLWCIYDTTIKHRTILIKMFMIRRLNELYGTFYKFIHEVVLLSK